MVKPVSSLQQEIEQLIPLLLEMASKRTYHTIHPHCLFILRDIKMEAELNIHQRRKMIIQENQSKQPLSLEEIMPALEAMKDDLYDIKLEVYRSEPAFSIIEIGYFRRSSLDDSYRQTVKDKATMIHCSIELPPWLQDTNAKFDINWRFHHFSNAWKLFLLGIQLKKERKKR